MALAVGLRWHAIKADEQGRFRLRLYVLHYVSSQKKSNRRWHSALRIPKAAPGTHAARVQGKSNKKQVWLMRVVYLKSEKREREPG